MAIKGHTKPQKGHTRLSKNPYKTILSRIFFAPCVTFFARFGTNFVRFETFSTHISTQRRRKREQQKQQQQQF